MNPHSAHLSFGSCELNFKIQNTSSEYCSACNHQNRGLSAAQHSNIFRLTADTEKKYVYLRPGGTVLLYSDFN